MAAWPTFTHLQLLIVWEAGAKGGKGDRLRLTLSQGVVELLFAF